VYATLDKQAKELLLKGKNVIYDGNLNRYAHRLEKYELCEHTGAKAVLLWIRTPKGIARNRAVLRGHKHLLPQNETFDTMFERVSKVLEEPREDEPVYTIDGVDLEESDILEIVDRV
jgi:predicted kinase